MQGFDHKASCRAQMWAKGNKRESARGTASEVKKSNNQKKGNFKMETLEYILEKNLLYLLLRFK